VLVANSEQDFLRVVGLLLEEEGFRAVTMHVSDATFAVIRGLIPRILIIDFQYGHTEAFDLLKALDADEVTRTLPLLATSTDERLLEQVQSTAPERPLLRLLVKPLGLDELLAAVRELYGAPMPSE
jgi:DNA-binding response OmpR family regulator